MLIQRFQADRKFDALLPAQFLHGSECDGGQQVIIIGVEVAHHGVQRADGFDGLRPRADVLQRHRLAGQQLRHAVQEDARGLLALHVLGLFLAYVRQRSEGVRQHDLGVVVADGSHVPEIVQHHGVADQDAGHGLRRSVVLSGAHAVDHFAVPDERVVQPAGHLLRLLLQPDDISAHGLLQHAFPRRFLHVRHVLAHRDVPLVYVNDEIPGQAAGTDGGQVLAGDDGYAAGRCAGLDAAVRVQPPAVYAVAEGAA